MGFFVNGYGRVAVELLPEKGPSDSHLYPLTYATAETRTFHLVGVDKDSDPAKKISQRRDSAAASIGNANTFALLAGGFCCLRTRPQRFRGRPESSVTGGGTSTPWPCPIRSAWTRRRSTKRFAYSTPGLVERRKQKV